MAQQTAVEWLVKEIDSQYPHINILWKQRMIEQAKQMEKEQIKAAYNKGYQDGEIDSLDAKDGDVQYFEDAERYYNETYGTE
jgi:Zn/Cd-binding protein ZinT